jgi:acetoin utilization protein AcuB
MDVASWMTRNPETIGPEDVLLLAESKMNQGGFRRLPVVDGNGGLVGILTGRDMQRHVGYFKTTRVDAAMTENPLTIAPDASIELAAQLMITKKIGGLPVLSDGRLVGVITTTDVLRAFLRSQEAARSGGEK